MIFVLLFYVADVFATEKPLHHPSPHYLLEEPHHQIPPLDSYETELPAGDPVHENYGVSEFWWEDSTTKWRPWWEKMNVTIPTPGSRLPPAAESNDGNAAPEKETTIKTSGGESGTTIVTSETSEGANKTTTQGVTTSQNETVAQNDTTVSPEKNSLDTSSTTELSVTSTTQTAEEQTKTYTDIPLSEIHDADLVVQLRAQQDLAAASPQSLAPDKPIYDYYGDLHDEIPPNLRGPEYSGLSLDIPVILKVSDNKTKEKRPPAIPGWRLQFPDIPSTTEKLADGTPKLEKTTFQINYADYFNVINDGMKIEPLPGEGTASLQPDSGFETKDSEKSAVTSGVNLRSMDYPGLHDKPAIPDSIEDGLGTYSPVPFKFDEVAARQELMALFSKAGREGMMKQPPTLKAVKALSPTYTVLYIETIGTPITGLLSTWFTSTTEPTTTTRFPTEPTTRFTTEPTTTTRFTTEPTTTTRFTTEPTTTTRVTSTTEPTTTLWITSTQPSTTGDGDGGDTIENTTLKPAPPLPNYIQTYQVDWNMFNTMRSTFTQEITTMPTTTSHPLIKNLKKEMAESNVGYFSVCLKKFFEIFSQKDNKVLRALLKGCSNALAKMNKHNELMGLGRPLWPGTELGFLKMRLAPIEMVKSRASTAFMFYSTGATFDVKRLHDSIDNLYYYKDGEDMVQALAAFEDYPGVNRDMNASEVMENLFRALLAPYFRDKKSPKMLSVLRDINAKLTIVSERFYGSNSRRNTQGEFKNTLTTNYNFKKKVVNFENSNKKIDHKVSDDTSEIQLYDFGGKETNAVEHNDGKYETKTINDSYEDVKTEKIESIVMIGDSNKKSKNTKDYDKDTYFRMSKAKDEGPGIVYEDSTTDSGVKERASKKLNCYDDECIDTNAVQKRARRNKYGKNEVRYRIADSKVRLSKDPRETSGQTRYQKITEMGLNVKHKVTEATILYHHDKYSNKKPMKPKYLKSYKNSKEMLISSKSHHGNRLLKDNKEDTYYTNRARNGEPNDRKWYLEIIKYNKSEPKSYVETDNKIDYINSKIKKSKKTKNVSGIQKLNCYDYNDEYTATEKTVVHKTNKYGQNKVGYRNAESKVRSLTDIKNKTRGQIEYINEGKIGYSIKHKVATNFNHIKNDNKEANKYPKTYKKATKSSIKDVENGLSKDINYTHYARNGEPSDKKWYLEIFKYKKSEPKTNSEKFNKISYINSKNKINGKTKYVSSTYKEGLILQTNEIKSQKISTTKATVKNSDFSYLTTKKTYEYETYDDETESNLSDKIENKISINGKSGLSKNKDDDYDTFDKSVDSKEINHSKTTNIHRKDEPNNKKAERKAFWNTVKANDYIKELRIKPTTKEYFRDIKHFYTTTISSHAETFQHKKIYKKNLSTQNHKIWSSSEEVVPTQTTITNATETEVPRYKNIKNSEGDVYSFENELKNKHQETNLKHYHNQFNAKESKTNVQNTKIPGNGTTRLSQKVLQKRFKTKQSPEAKNNEKRQNYSQSSNIQDVYSETQDLKQKDLGFKNKKGNILKISENNKNKSSDNDKIIKFWLDSKSKYIVNNDAPYLLKERFRDFNRDHQQTKKKYSLRHLDKNKNILRVESSYSDEEEILKFNLQDNLLHGGRNFTDTLHKYKKSNPIRDISGYSDEEDTLKKNIYKLFT